MPERAGERRLGPPELQCEQPEPDRDERDSRPRKHEQREAGEERHEAAERNERAHCERPLAVPRAPLAEAFQGGHATAAPRRSPSLRSRYRRYGAESMLEPAARWS